MSRERVRSYLANLVGPYFNPCSKLEHVDKNMNNLIPKDSIRFTSGFSGEDVTK